MSQSRSEDFKAVRGVFHCLKPAMDKDLNWHGILSYGAIGGESDIWVAFKPSDLRRLVVSALDSLEAAGDQTAMKISREIDLTQYLDKR